MVSVGLLTTVQNIADDNLDTFRKITDTV